MICVRQAAHQDRFKWNHSNNMNNTCIHWHFGYFKWNSFDITLKTQITKPIFDTEKFKFHSGLTCKWKSECFCMLFWKFVQLPLYYLCQQILNEKHLFMQYYCWQIGFLLSMQSKRETIVESHFSNVSNPRVKKNWFCGQLP